MRLELENAENPDKSLLTQPQASQATEETAGLDSAGAVTNPAAAASGSLYNWDNIMQLESTPPPQPTPPQQQQQHSSYLLTEANSVLADNGWYSQYSNEATNYGLYSGVPTSTPVLNYEAAAYDAGENRPIYSEACEAARQYTELVDTAPNYAGEYYHDYGQMYGAFDNQAFGYGAADGAYSACVDEVYTYTESGSFGLGGGAGGAGSDGHAVSEGVPKVESSSSSSEEDTLEMGSSLASIVKETMVSV